MGKPAPIKVTFKPKAGLNRKTTVGSHQPMTHFFNGDSDRFLVVGPAKTTGDMGPKAMEKATV